jgi:pilus assembly protein CpaC
MTLSPKNALRSWFVAGAVLAALMAAPPGAFSAEPSQQAPMGDEIPLTIGKSIVLDIPDEIQRVALTDETVADAIAISTREVLINAKAEGVTTLVLWSRSGDRTFFTISVAPNIRMVQDHLRATFPGEQVRITSNRGVMTLNGKVSDPAVEERIISLLQGMGAGAVVSNLELPVPAADRQILLRVKFLEVQRNAIREFGTSIFSTGAGGTIGAVGTQQFGSLGAPAISGTIGAPLSGSTTSFSLTDTLNILAFRPDLNIGAVVKLLQTRGLSELLAEPNVVATSGKQADLLVGGEFPVPVIQGGSSAGAVTVQFREFGIRIGFLPTFTPRGSIQMHVKPEVSALDYANALQLSGFLIPALATRRVETDVELMPGQSFVIGGLLDKRLVESINRIPGLSNIPLLGELFKSRSRTQNNTELLVVVTPEFPDLIEAGAPQPSLTMPRDFLPPISEDPQYQEDQK